MLQTHLLDAAPTTPSPASPHPGPLGPPRPSPSHPQPLANCTRPPASTQLRCPPPAACRPHSRLRPGPSPCALLPRFCLPDQTPGSLGAGPSRSHHQAAFEDSVDAATKLRGPNQAVQQGVGPSVNACVCTHTCPCAHIYTHTCVCSPVHVEWARPPAGTAVGQAAIVKQRAFCTPRRRAGGKTVRPVSCRTGSPALEAAVQGVQTTRLPDAGGGPRLGQPPARRSPFPRSLLEAPCDGPWGRQRGRPEAPLAPQAVICRPPPASSPSRIRNPPPPPGQRGLGPEAGAPAALSLRSAGVPPGWEGGVAWALDEAHQADPSLPPQATLSHNSGRKAWWFLPETLESKGPCRCQGHHHRDH